ncbi:MAG: ATP-binding cassette domain-containing protein [Lachnospiraceae bacterium]|nr:ATP-binding cassette domain-containing protein [Lachnospiraceae bacterium]
MTDEKNIPLIEVRDLKKYYPIKGGVITHTTGHIRAVDGVSFSIPKGQTLGLVGESGCGKSTIGRQLVGLETPTAGTICYNGCDLEAIRKDKKQLRQIRTKLQIVFQDPYSSLNPRKHIFEILSQPMLYHHISTKASVEQDILKLLDMVGLPKTVLGRYPHEFSGGQRQRIAIAKALSLNPEFIVCDEPVSALDVSIQAQILNLLRELQKELDLTLLFVGHGLGAVNYVSNQIAVMYLGKIVEIGEAKEVFRHPVHPYTKALLEAVPVPDTAQKDKERRLLQGEVGSNTNPPDGCRFHNRCPYATDACAQEEPTLEQLPAQSVFRAEQIYAGNEHTTDIHKVACPMMLEHMQNRMNSTNPAGATVPEAARNAVDAAAGETMQEEEAHG